MNQLSPTKLFTLFPVFLVSKNPLGVHDLSLYISFIYDQDAEFTKPLYSTVQNIHSSYSTFLVSWWLLRLKATCSDFSVCNILSGQYNILIDTYFINVKISCFEKSETLKEQGF